MGKRVRMRFETEDENVGPLSGGERKPTGEVCIANWAEFVSRVEGLQTDFGENERYDTDLLHTPSTGVNLLPDRIGIVVNHDLGDESTWGRIRLVPHSDWEVEVDMVYNRWEVFFDALVGDIYPLSQAYDIVAAEAIDVESDADWRERVGAKYCVLCGWVEPYSREVGEDWVDFCDKCGMALTTDT